MKKLIPVIAVVLIATSCSKSPIKETAPALKTTEKTLSAGGSCGTGEGTRYFQAINGIVTSGICVNNSGSIYSSGYLGNYNYQSSLDGSPVTNDGTFYLGKGDINGNFQWVKEMAGGIQTIAFPSTFNACTLPGILSDKAGNVYSLYVKTVHAPYADFSSYILSKYNSNGQQQWQINQNLGATDAKMIMNADDNGNIYLFGNYNAATIVNMNQAPALGLPLTGEGTFTEKIDINGKVAEVHQLNITPYEGKFTGYVYPNINNVSMDSNGNLYIIGPLYGQNTVDNNVYKIDFRGNIIWKADLAQYNAYAIYADNKGNAVVSGTNSSTNATTIAGIDALGHFKWKHEIATPQPVLASAVVFDSPGNAYIVYPSYNPSGNLAILKIDPAGNYIWQKFVNPVLGSTSFTISAATIDSNYVYITGDLFDGRQGVQNLEIVQYISKVSLCN